MKGRNALRLLRPTTVRRLGSWGAPRWRGLGLDLSNPLAAANRGQGRDFHDRRLATGGAAPP